MQTECNVYACLRMVMKQDLSTSLYVINNYLTHLLEWTAEYKHIDKNLRLSKIYFNVILLTCM